MTERRILAKILLLGDGSVGKTSLILNFVHGMFRESYKATIGIDIYRKEIYLSSIKKTYESIKFFLQLWDISGQQSFELIRKKFYGGAAGSIIVFDKTNPKSFENVTMWKNELREYCDKEAPFVIAGNKSDLIPIISPETIYLWLQKEKYDPNDYFDTSAATGHNVENMFSRIAEQIYLTKRHLTPGSIDN